MRCKTVSFVINTTNVVLICGVSFYESVLMMLEVIQSLRVSCQALWMVQLWYAIMIHHIFVTIIVVVVSCCEICDAFVIKSYLPATNSLQKKHPSNAIQVNNCIKHSSPSSKLHVVNNNRGIELSNVFYDDTDMAFRKVRVSIVLFYECMCLI